MTITSEAIEQKFINAYQADKPCFVVNNILTGAGFSGVANKWMRDTTHSPTAPTWASTGSATEANDSTLPISLSLDNRASVFTSPADGSANNVYYWGLYAARWQTIAAASYSEYKQDWFIDSVVLKMQRTGSGAQGYLNDQVEIDVIASESTSFSPSYSLLDTLTADAVDDTSNPHPSRTTTRTFVSVIPAAGNFRFKLNGDGYFRLQLYMNDKTSSGTNYFDSRPRVGELFIGERIQMSRAQNQPYSTELAYTDGSTTFESNTGDKVRYVRYKGQRRFELTFSPSGSDSYGIDDVEQIRLLAKKTKQFTEPFMYIPKPYSEPRNAYFVIAEDASFQMESVGPFERSVTLRLVEIPPFVDYEAHT
jgi:hypothetical protein